ncbi:hypothetical protein CDD83_6933 [Cordyceps sp. RAO-2017]|nr:hypothetical protein CDD83_6933 [Cordyceps sp. RAO-2017]
MTRRAPTVPTAGLQTNMSRVPSSWAQGVKDFDALDSCVWSAEIEQHTVVDSGTCHPKAAAPQSSPEPSIPVLVRGLPSRPSASLQDGPGREAQSARRVDRLSGSGRRIPLRPGAISPA